MKRDKMSFVAVVVSPTQMHPFVRAEIQSFEPVHSQLGRPGLFSMNVHI